LTRQRQALAWLVAGAAFLGLVWLLSGVLLPFVAGLVVAYFLDPLADRLERLGASRTVATLVITVAFFLVAGGALVLLFPLLQAQVAGFVSRLPGYLQSLRELSEPLLQRLQATLTAQDLEQLRAAAQSVAGKAVAILGDVAARLWAGGMALLHLLSLVLITPLVAFYMLRDWDRIVARVDDWLPRPFAPVIREQVKQIDRTLAGFIRGQATVCLILGLFYGIGLSLVGLDFGLLVGLGTGFISFVPYFGMGTGLVVGFGIALAQFPDPLHLGLVAGVFLAGQLIEGNFLTPKLVGEKVGLHPVWVIFALMAGGALFGFTGILLAVPVAAVIGVMVRFWLGQYLKSALYHGGPGGAAGGGSAGG
jgi:predicted PurR-regulated permease PerM